MTPKTIVNVYQNDGELIGFLHFADACEAHKLNADLVGSELTAQGFHIGERVTLSLNPMELI